MNRRTFLRNSSFFAGAALLPSHAWLAQSLFANGEMTLLRNNVGYYTERGGTIGWLLSPDHSIVVDTQFPDQANNLITKLNETNAQPLDLLVNTHHHGDHTSGNIAFKDHFKTHVAHANSKANQERVAREREQLDQTLLPGTTFADQWSQRVGDETISLYHFGPAHTNGDAFVHFENANVVHTGDLVFNRRFPYIDKSAGANIQNWIQVLRKGRKQFDKDTLFMFGHSGEGYPITGTAADLKAMENYLRSLLKFMKRSIRKGASLEDLKANTTAIPGAPEWKGQGIERSLDSAWAELTEE